MIRADQLSRGQGHSVQIKAKNWPRGLTSLLSYCICLSDGDNSYVFCVHTHIQPAKLMQSIVSCAQLEDAVEEERLHLSSVEVDVEDVERFKSQLKGLYIFLIVVVLQQASDDRVVWTKCVDCNCVHVT